MNNRFIKTGIVFFSIMNISIALAKDASVSIASPMDGAQLLSSAKNKIDFTAEPGPKGDHVHITVDDGEPIVVRQLKGSYTFEKLEAGNRDICVKLMDKNHTPVGAEKCIKVKVGAY